jgi:hypothetical protein
MLLLFKKTKLFNDLINILHKNNNLKLKKEIYKIINSYSQEYSFFSRLAIAINPHS